jgi:hypothetical protein
MANLYDEKILGTKQKIALAQKLRESGQDMLPGQMIGDRYVAPSWTQHLAQGLKQGLGTYQEMKGEQELKNLETQRLKDVIAAKQGLGIPATQQELEAAGTPTQSPSIWKRAGALFTGEAQPQGTPAVPMQQPPVANFETLPPAQQAMAMSNAAGIIPTEAAAYMTIKEHQATRDATKQKLIDEADLKRDLQTERLQFQETQKEQDRALRQSLAELVKRQAPQGSIVEIIDPKDNTKMIKINSVTGEVYGTSGTEPKALIRQEKVQTKLDEQAKGQENFQSSLYNLRDEYKTLNSLGSIKTDQDSSIANALGVKLKTSTGQLLGTKTGTAISNIEQARKSIIQDIKNATGMSAGQLNSNFELQNMLATVTDPNSSYEAVQDQLNTLSQKFGTGEAIFPERLKLKQQANMVQGQAPVTTQPPALEANQAPKPTVSGW